MTVLNTEDFMDIGDLTGETHDVLLKRLIGESVLRAQNNIVQASEQARRLMAAEVEEQELIDRFKQL